MKFALFFSAVPFAGFFFFFEANRAVTFSQVWFLVLLTLYVGFCLRTKKLNNDEKQREILNSILSKYCAFQNNEITIDDLYFSVGIDVLRSKHKLHLHSMVVHAATMSFGAESSKILGEIVKDFAVNDS